MLEDGNAGKWTKATHWKRKIKLLVWFAGELEQTEKLLLKTCLEIILPLWIIIYR